MAPGEYLTDWNGVTCWCGCSNPDDYPPEAPWKPPPAHTGTRWRAFAGRLGWTQPRPILRSMAWLGLLTLRG